MKTVRFAVSFGLAIAIAGAQAQQGPWDKYIWETCRTTNVSPSAKDMVAELRREAQKILGAGPLAPHRTVYADLEQDEYFVYWQGGRIITTLAMAYPHLTAAQQAAVKKYVQSELDDETRAPWCPKGYIAADNGVRRELHSFKTPMGFNRYWSMWGNKKPTMGGFYGLWLYADRTGDWDAIKKHYPKIVAFYSQKAKQCDIYGTMGAPIAMARIAGRFGDSQTRDAAVALAADVFNMGKDFAEAETRAQKYWPERYQPRQRRGAHQGWMFLDLCPEVGRYLADHVKDDVLKRHGDGLTRYPFFWLRETAYSSRWTGDEGLGIPTELMGMIVPIERWVAGASAETLARYTRSTPICIGDCYWIEMLVSAIEATGTTTWVSVK